MGNFDANELWDLSPVPTLVVSQSYCIQRVSDGLLHAWNRQREGLIGTDLFVALYGGSPLEHFDRIPLMRAIEVAIAARNYRLCHAAYFANDATWSARVIPIFKQDEMLSLVLEWEQIDITPGGGGGEIIHNMLSADEMFRLLIQGVKDYAIFLLDTRGYVATWNTGAELLKGFQREDIVGKHFCSFYGEEDLKNGKPENELIQCLREGRVEDEGWRYRKDGSRFWANVVITAIYRNGVHVGFGKVTRDLTERREGELRLIAAYEESSKLKNDFLANISHEIRTPMHGMLSACSLLLDTPLAEDQRETANIISESGQVLLQVINGILDYSKLASGNFSVNSDLVGVASIISSVVRNVQMALRPGVYIKLNIVDNVAKFTEKGLILVQASVVEEDEASYTILTEVSDTGIGVADDAAENLFKPFTQLEKPNKKRFQDGLSAKRPRRGSVFWFTAKFKKIVLEQLDSIEMLHGEEVEKSQQLSEQEKARLALGRLQEIAPRKRLLAAEDNIINQKVLIGMLRSFGFKDISMALDGAQAVSLLNSSPDAYDLVLMDVSMPVMDGFEATATIRNSGMQIPIIAMTAYALRGDMEACLERGMDDYIPKPMNKNLLLQRLLRWLDVSCQPEPVTKETANSHGALALRIMESACQAG
ncbi:Two-component system protein A [Cladobotryum mycophilum]|uniref:Two-component system protein A n=1 Tax=Cladobotryum mycophilum TaxID=491253 RepID=A0ABR0S9H3_9HYPO